MNARQAKQIAQNAPTQKYLDAIEHYKTNVTNCILRCAKQGMTQVGYVFDFESNDVGRTLEDDQFEDIKDAVSADLLERGYDVHKSKEDLDKILIDWF